MAYVFWEGTRQDLRKVTVRVAEELAVPAVLYVVASLSDTSDLRGRASYIELHIPDVGADLAWIGVPGGKANEGHFIHPKSGRTWPRGDLNHAVRFALDYPRGS